MNKQRLAEFGLLACALFWGMSGLLAQVAMNQVTPFNLTFFRFIIAGLVSIIIFKVNPLKMDTNTLRHAFKLSILLFIIYISSTYGLKYTTASNASFIIGSTVFLVPVLNRIFFKVKVSKREFLCIITSFIGLGLVTLKGAKALNVGDLLCLVDAFAYSSYMIYNSRLKSDSDPLKIGSIQFIFVAMFSFIYVLIFEGFTIPSTVPVVASIIALGVLCTFAAFIIQNVAQRHTSATRTSTIFTLMPVFTVIFDYMFTNTQLSTFALIGGTMIVISTIYMGISNNDDSTLKIQASVSNYLD